jgi:hypothetical protein
MEKPLDGLMVCTVEANVSVYVLDATGVSSTPRESEETYGFSTNVQPELLKGWS